MEGAVNTNAIINILKPKFENPVMVFLLNCAQTKANHIRFIKRAAKNEAVWLLKSEEGIANSTSHEEYAKEILMFWSDRAYAARVRKGPYADYYSNSIEEEVSLFDFLYRWLPGMYADEVLAGTNWNQGLVGTEIDPFELREGIENAMQPKQRAAYEAQYESLKAEES